MPKLTYQPVPHDHAEFLAKARTRAGFGDAYDALELEYQLIDQLLKARAPSSLRMRSPHAWEPPRVPFRGLNPAASMGRVP
jgi:hypothetical protein